MLVSRIARSSSLALPALALLLAGCPSKPKHADAKTAEAKSGETRDEGPASEVDGTDTDGEATAVSDSPAKDGAPDPHSFARPDQVAVKHMGFDWRVDFEHRMLSGTALMTLERKTPGAPLMLDTRALSIASVRYRTDPPPKGKPLFELNVPRDDADETKWTEAKWRFGDGESHKGRPMIIEVPDDATVVAIEYSTTEDGTGLQWLEPAQTAGGKHPFLYSQSQAIHARTWMPVQDSPGVRVTYDARVDYPATLESVMSAERTMDPAKLADREIVTFEMKQAIPAYLIALGIGDLKFSEVGPNTGVWADPSIVSSAAEELAPMEKMIDAAERLYGPYRWGRYDVLILPPAFPFGGMENPRMTFATPTILAGDGSLLSLIAHELAHSWSGNLVTNATWSDLWLNEGFTVYAERRMVESLYGEDRMAMEAMLGRQDLEEDLAEGIEEEDLRRLRPDLSERDPDDNFSDVPYEKGALLLFTLEAAYGRETFDRFMKKWFDDHAFTSVTTKDFVAFTEQHLFNTPPVEGNKPDLDAWISGTTLPKRAPEWHTEAIERVEAAARRFLAGETTAAALAWDDWTTHQRLAFLRALAKDITLDQMKALDAARDLTHAGNSEIAAQWYQTAAAKNYTAADEAMKAFLLRVGRRKFLVPIYKALLQREGGEAQAKAIYAEARPGYHAISTQTLDDLVGN